MSTAPDEELLDFVGDVRRVFGACTVHIKHPDHWKHVAIPAPAGYQRPIFKPQPVQTSARDQSGAHQREIVFRRKR